MTPPRTLVPRLASTLFALPVLLGASAAAAQTPPAQAVPAATFEYAAPGQKTYLRGVLEFGGLYAFGLLWYNTSVVGWDPGYRWDLFRQKLTTARLEHDFNGFGTNFRGHATGGTGYYLAARSNRLSAGESFSVAVFGAVAWEYFGEVSEKVSLNDVIYTPLSGTAIAESFIQLGAFFDRAPRTTTNRVLGTLFGPIKTLNDTLDGLPLARRSAGAPGREWHEFPLQVGFASVREGGNLPGAARTGEIRLALSERLARLVGYDGAAEQDDWFDDAQLSGIRLGAAFAPHGLSDFLFEPHAVMVGHYWRSAHGKDASLTGTGYATGLRIGLTYQMHDYRRELPSDTDFAAFVEPIGWFFESRTAAGPTRLRLTLDAGPEYGGLRPIALSKYRGPVQELPRELTIFNYYFGLGGRVRTQLELTYRGLRLDAGMTGWALGSVDEHVPIPIADGYARFSAGLGYDVGAGATLRAFAERAERYGRMGPTRADARELNLGAEGVARF